MSQNRRAFPVHILVFLAPALLIYTLFMIYPLIDTLRLSLYASTPQDKTQEIFVGFDNYKTLLTNEQLAPRLGGAIKNNAIFFAIHMIVQNPLGLLLASLLASPFIYGRSIYRTMIFMPTLLSFVLVGFVWQIMLNPLWGIAKDILGVVGMQSLYQPWLGLESSALVVIGLISVWQYVGVPMMLFLAALVTIPDELIEAARVDGATALSIFWRIKLPLLLPTVGIVMVLTFVGNFNAFDLVYTIQGGLAGPNFSSDLLGTFFYRTFFGFQLQQGNPTMGAAIAGVMFFIILAGVLLYLFGWQRRMLQLEY